MAVLLGTLLALSVLVMVALAWLWTRLPRGLRGVLAEYGFPAFARAVRFCCRTPAQFDVTLVAEVWGRAVILGFVGIMLWDASWGANSVGVPLVGVLGLFAAATSTRYTLRVWAVAKRQQLELACPRPGLENSLERR